MVKSNIRIFTHGQRLGTGKSVPHYAGETVHYIGAYFELDESWEDYDSVRAVWWNGAVEKATVFDATMTCTIPLEVVAKKGIVMVNLIASVSEDGVLTDRFTSYPFKVAVIDADVKLTGSETVPVTPSQFEQFVEVVKNDADRAYSEADRATDEANRAEQAAEGAEASATGAEASATDAESAKTAALEAKGAAETAQASAEQAQASAEQSATTAAASATQAGQSASDAQTAKTDAETAQTAAEAAKDTAVANATTATTKAAEAAQSASSASDSETAAEAAATRAEQAAASLTVDNALSETSENPVQNKVITGEVTQLRSATVEIQGEIADLKSALNNVTGNGIIEKTTGYYINVTTSQASINSPTANTNYSYSLIECAEGDKFTVSAEVSGAMVAWAFAKSDGTTILASSGGASVDSALLTAPANTAYLIINDRGDLASYSGELIKNALAAMNEDSEKLLEAQYFHDWVVGGCIYTNTTTTYKPEKWPGWNYAIIDCDSSNEYIITGTGGSSSRLWAFFDSNGSRLSVAPANTTEVEKTLIVPSGATKLVINVNTTQPYSLLIRKRSDAGNDFEEYALTKTYSIDEFIANKTYPSATVGSYLSSLDPISSGTGNYCLSPIPVKASQRVLLQADKYSRVDACAMVVDESLLVVMAYNNCENGIQFTIPVDGYLLVSTLPSRFHGLTVYGLTETQVDNGSFKDIYCPYSQLPANSDSSSDFDAETLTSDALFSYLDELSAKHPFILTSENMGKDASGEYDVKRYTIMPRTALAWLDSSTPFRYKWTYSSTNYYTDSWFPKVGDTVYSSATGSGVAGTVSSVNSETQTIVINGNTCSRSGTNRSEQNIVFSSSFTVGASLITEAGASAGTISSISGNTITSSNGNTYNRFPMYDKNQFGNYGTIYIGANEHGPTSDPRDCAIVVTRLIKDIVEGRNDDYISYLRSNFRLVILPICNPWGFNQQTAGRLNYNGVNLNRNYPTPGWNVISDTDKGSAPASEIEMQYMINTVAQSGANVGIDIHCLGYVTPANDGRCEYMGVKDYFAINRVALCLKANYNLSLGNYGSVDPATTATGASFFRMLGIDGGLLEFQARQGNTRDIDTELHTAQTMSANYTFLLQMLNMYLSDHNRMLDIKYAD